MNFKKMGLGLAATAAMTAGVALAEAPAQALTFGDKLVFSTDDEANPNLASLTANGGGLFSFDAGAIDIDFASDSVFGVASAAIGDSVLTLQQIAPQSGAVASYQLVGTSVQWLSGLADEVGGFTRTYTLDSFILNQTSLSSVAGFAFSATFNGFFQPPTSGVQGIGGLGGFGTLSSSDGSAIAGAITVVPTPALLPGLVGMGLAALRKRKDEQAAEQPEAVKA